MAAWHYNQYSRAVTAGLRDKKMGSLGFKFYFNQTLERKITKAFKYHKLSTVCLGFKIGCQFELFQAGLDCMEYLVFVELALRDWLSRAGCQVQFSTGYFISVLANESID